MNIPEFVQLTLPTVTDSHAKVVLTDKDDIANVNYDGLRKVFGHSGPWPPGLVEATQPIPIFLPRYRMNELKNLTESLHAAVCDIVERWWTDLDARFWERMPIDPKAEAVLRWITDKRDQGVPYRKISGFWRPDVLVSNTAGQVENGPLGEGKKFGSFKICEINCRYPLSGYLVASTLDKFYSKELKGSPRFQTTVGEVDEVIQRKFSRHSVVWFLHGEGIYHIDLVNMKSYFENHRLNNIRFVKPEHLKTVADVSSPSGYKLVAIKSSSDLLHEDETDTEMEIDIVVIEARQAQLVALPTNVLQQLALRAVNDLRSIFLTHDKRMLGLVLQELAKLENERGVISSEQAECLRRGIAETYIPNSKEMAKQLKAMTLGQSPKNQWVLKPIASGKGKGIIFGSDVATEEQFNKLVQDSEVSRANVLQRIVSQPRFKMVAPNQKFNGSGIENGNEANPQSLRYLVGTFMMSDGYFLGTLWRASPEPICAFSQGAWLLNALTEREEVKDS